MDNGRMVYKFFNFKNGWNLIVIIELNLGKVLS